MVRSSSRVSICKWSQIFCRSTGSTPTVGSSRISKGCKSRKGWIEWRVIDGSYRRMNESHRKANTPFLTSAEILYVAFLIWQVQQRYQLLSTHFHPFGLNVVQLAKVQKSLKYGEIQKKCHFLKNVKMIFIFDGNNCLNKPEGCIPDLWFWDIRIVRRNESRKWIKNRLQTWTWNSTFRGTRRVPINGDAATVRLSNAYYASK